MKTLRRAATCAALGLVASQSFATPADGLAATEGQPAISRPAPPAQPPQPAQARLVAALRSKIPIEPVGLKGNPYLIGHSKQPAPTPPGMVCGVRFEQDQVHYRLSTFADSQAARTAGFAVTHFGGCGTCSTLQDLAVYLETPDLTAPVRRCGFRWDATAGLRCLEDLGLSTACAQTWLYDADNTRQQCLSACIWSWIKGEAPTRNDGRLNACLQCDEDRSGPVFKATAGRTRRNSGIRSSIPRPEEQIAPLIHDYIPDPPPR